MKPQFIKKIVAVGVFAAQVLAINAFAQEGVHADWRAVNLPALWSDPANWSGGVVPVSGYKAVFNTGLPSGGEPCIIDTAVGGCQISLGDSGGPCTIIVTNGGYLSSGDTAFGNLDNNAWTGVGTGGAGTLIIGEGGEVKFNYHLWIALADSASAVGTLIMNGGVASVTNNPNANWRCGSGLGTGTGYIYMNGGTLLLGKWDAGRITGNSKVDISGGKIIVTGGDRVANITAEINAGRITAYGGTGTVNVDYNTTTPNMTTITATPGGGGGGGDSTITGIDVSNGTVTITYTTELASLYHIESSPNVVTGNWTLVLGSNTVGTGSPATYSFPQGASPEFYRVVSP